MKQDIRKVKNIEDWIRYFSDNLDWDIDFDEIDDIDDISYEYTPEELGLKPESCAKIRSLKQLRPLTNDQPWGIFCVEFEGNRFEITALRRILSTQIPRRRRYVTDRRTWNLNDLLFICSWGEGNETTLGLAHFEEREGVLPQLKVIYCAPAKEDTHNIHTFEERIGHLQWPSDPSDTESWRGNWSAAFTSGYRQTIHAAAELTKRLAEEALAIRDRILHTLEIETEQGYVHGLYNKFKEQLLHDMQEKDFADMYAQTIVYGLFSARCMDDSPETFSAAEAVEHIPSTNPFLKDLLKECLDVKTRSGISFDELEVGNVVDILAGIDPKEIVQDFGRQTGGGREDPVLHFYEEFLNAYDKTQKVQRGVYYTPQPVVNFIVRAVDDILKNEFGLKDGLASTETKMVEMQVEKSQPGKSGLKTVIEKVPVPVVQVLDPATGTGTFLRQVILQIYENFKAAYKGESDAAVRKAWNEYVPKNLLPRINGFELMMAPYAVAHMKLAMVLQETGYDFRSNKRLQVYLTNTLEKPGKTSLQTSFLDDTDPLATESIKANETKNNEGINILIGNPPYAGESANKGPWIMALMEDYKKEPDGKIKLQERNPKWLNDDYVKFIRYAQYILFSSESGILAYICPHGFLDNPTFRGMRWNLMSSFDSIHILNLHGNAKKSEKCPDGSKDENVFDIQQGVNIILAIKKGSQKHNADIFYSDLYGLRSKKYHELNQMYLHNIVEQRLEPQKPQLFFVPKDFSTGNEYLSKDFFGVDQLFLQNSVGFVSSRDSLCIQNSKETIQTVVEDFSKLSEDQAREKYKLGKDVRDWRVLWAQEDIKKHRKNGIVPSELLTKIAYRPFDNRYTYYSGVSRGFLCYPRFEVLSNMVKSGNLALCLTKVIKTGDTFQHVFVAEHPIDSCYVSNKTSEITYAMPLYVYSGEICIPNFDQKIKEKLSYILKIPFSQNEADSVLHPKSIFYYIYAVLHSQKYRTKYIEFLKTGFPRIPYPHSTDEFISMTDCGKQLVALHLLQKAQDTSFIYTDIQDATILKIEYKDGQMFINNKSYIEISEKVWSFQIGAYQPLQKWLKDRKGMTLSDEDIEHYKQMITAIQRTIEIMDKIDQVIEL